MKFQHLKGWAGSFRRLALAAIQLACLVPQMGFVNAQPAGRLKNGTDVTWELVFRGFFLPSASLREFSAPDWELNDTHYMSVTRNLEDLAWPDMKIPLDPLEWSKGPETPDFFDSMGLTPVESKTGPEDLRRKARSIRLQAGMGRMQFKDMKPFLEPGVQATFHLPNHPGGHGIKALFDITTPSRFDIFNWPKATLVLNWRLHPKEPKTMEQKGLELPLLEDQDMAFNLTTEAYFQIITWQGGCNSCLLEGCNALCNGGYLHFRDGFTLSRVGDGNDWEITGSEWNTCQQECGKGICVVL